MEETMTVGGITFTRVEEGHNSLDIRFRSHWRYQLDNMSAHEIRIFCCGIKTGFKTGYLLENSLTAEEGSNGKFVHRLADAEPIIKDWIEKARIYHQTA